MLKILTSDILLQEIPNEISLGLAVTGCPFKCIYCHTPDLQKDIGETFDWYKDIIEKYSKAITCVLFLGGDKRETELIKYANIIKDEYGLKTAVYLGRNDLPSELLESFDYIKIGPYNHKLGGLESPTTNQRLYKIVDKEPIDITYLFHRERG